MEEEEDRDEETGTPSPTDAEDASAAGEGGGSRTSTGKFPPWTFNRLQRCSCGLESLHPRARAGAGLRPSVVVSSWSSAIHRVAFGGATRSCAVSVFPSSGF